MPLPTKRVLLVEDEWLTLMMVAEEFRRAGFTVVEAGRGDDALALIDKTDDIDALVTNFRLPGADGAEVATAARKRFPSLPIVFISATSQVLTSRRVPEPHHLMDKPFETDELVRLIRQLLVEA